MLICIEIHISKIIQNTSIVGARLLVLIKAPSFKVTFCKILFRYSTTLWKCQEKQQKQQQLNVRNSSIFIMINSIYSAIFAI